MIKKLIIGFVFLFSIASVAQKENDILGKYVLPNGLEVEIFPVNNAIFEAKISSVENYQEKKDRYNSDKSKRKNDLQGKVILNNLKYNTQDEIWEDGTLYAPEKGMHVNFKITESNPDEITVVVSKFIFHKTMKWKKIKTINDENNESK